MDHDAAKENWARGANRYCDCPPFRYSPAHNHMRTTNPECSIHGQPGTTENRTSTTAR